MMSLLKTRPGSKKVKKKSELSKEMFLAIENARKRIKAGNFVLEEEARKKVYKRV